MLTFKFIFKTLIVQYPHPRNWPLLMALILTKLLLNLPVCVLAQIGRGFGYLGFYLAKRRRQIAFKNIQACFPEWSAVEHMSLLKAHFISLGLGVIEMAAAWLMPSKRMNRLIHVHIVSGEEYLAKIQEASPPQSALFVTGHFIPLDIIGRYFGERGHFDLVYQQHNHPLFEAVTREGRSYAGTCIERREIRKMLRSLKEHHILLYSPDQDFGALVSVFAPFFGIPCATNRGISWISAKSGAFVLAGSFRRLKLFHYEMVIVPLPIPSGSEEQDAKIYNQWLEQAIRLSPADYFWVHRRFKTRPEGEMPFYGG